MKRERPRAPPGRREGQIVSTVNFFVLSTHIHIFQYAIMHVCNIYIYICILYRRTNCVPGKLFCHFYTYTHIPVCNNVYM